MGAHRSRSRPLRIADVRAAIAASDEPDLHVKLGADDGRLPQLDNTAVLLEREDGTWFTAFFERGRYQYPEVHPTEDAACRGFLAMVQMSTPPAGRPWWRRW